mgnify:FL=1
MGSWRDEILHEFQPEVARLTLVADPDGLLLEEGVLRGLEERGFELIPFEDPIAFRYAYESRYRSRWDRGEDTELVVVLRSPKSDVRTLPFDLLEAGRVLAFGLGALFPNLSRPVVDGLDRRDLDALYGAQARHGPERPLGRRQTESFILRHVFGVAPETIRSEADLLKVLLERHYKGMRIPASLDGHLIRGLRENPDLREWPLEDIVPHREQFFRFLQERWPIYLDRIAPDGRVGHEMGPRYGLKVPGPEELPFDHHDVRVYVDNLFLEGILTPVSHPSATSLQGSWAAAGVLLDPKTDFRRRWRGLLDAAASSLPEEGVGHAAWSAFAWRWSRLVSLRHGQGSNLDDEEIAPFQELQSRIDAAFHHWLVARFATLHNQPPVPPVMVHHVPRHLARRLDRDATRVALVVLDGLSLDQWILVRKGLEERDPGIHLREDAVFAWVPTLTPVSRQACFAGNPPFHFPQSIHDTSREEALWKRFWEGEGVPGEKVGYQRAVRTSEDLERVENLVDRTSVPVVGLVVDQVDRIMHGMKLGTAGMQNQVRQWTEGGCLAGLLTLLLRRDFTVFLTSDHGNVEARGCGRPSEGAVADYRGQRARVFPDPALRNQVQKDYPASVAWSPAGLPEEYFPLLSPARTAFVPEGETVVAHGGALLEEVIVPLIEVEAR